MALPIFFSEDISSEDFLTLSEETSKHIVQVLRMKSLGRLKLTDGRGSLVSVMIQEADKKKCTVKVVDRKFENKKDGSVSIAISLLKNASRFEWFLEKATEIGVSEIIPLLCSRTEKQHFRYDRMKAILISSMLQSQQVWLPSLHEPVAADKIISNSTHQTKWIAHCEEGEKNSITPRTDAQILIGPEGDFTNEEIQLAVQKNYEPVTLGNTRLRTETAGIVAATLLCRP